VIVISLSSEVLRKLNGTRSLMAVVSHSLAAAFAAQEISSSGARSMILSHLAALLSVRALEVSAEKTECYVAVSSPECRAKS
jgi:hypothetical protein